MFTRARHWLLSWKMLIKSTPFYQLLLRLILISSFHLRLSTPPSFSPSTFPTSILYASLISSMLLTMSRQEQLVFLTLVLFPMFVYTTRYVWVSNVASNIEESTWKRVFQKILLNLTQRYDSDVCSDISLELQPVVCLTVIRT